MDNEVEIVKELTETTARSKSNTKRIGRLEETQEEIRTLATSTAVMAERLGTVESNVSDIKTTVTELKDKPAKRHDNIVETVIGLIVAALVGFLLRGVGL